jgi:hypothetical protein
MYYKVTFYAEASPRGELFDLQYVGAITNGTGEGKIVELTEEQVASLQGNSAVTLEPTEAPPEPEPVPEAVVQDEQAPEGGET